MLSATIAAGAFKIPVRIRNLSETGAMIEGATFPPLGTILTLYRADLEITATVIWIAVGRCGIAFIGRASVDEWVAGVRRPGGQEERGQTGVDTIQAALRSGASQQSEIAPAAHRPVNVELLDGRIAEELAYVRRLLDTISDELSDDPIMLQRHSRNLQSLDAAGQLLGHLASVIGAHDRAEAVSSIAMEELRARLLRR